MFKKFVGFFTFLTSAVLFISTASATNEAMLQSGSGDAAFVQNPTYEPYAGASKCSYHNPHEWHGLWDYQHGCYYDHEHKHNPGILYAGMPAYERREAEAMLRVFGEPGAWFGGTSISYPWQTFKGAGVGYEPRPTDYTRF